MPRHHAHSPADDTRLRALIAPACYVVCALGKRQWKAAALGREAFAQAGALASRPSHDGPLEEPKQFARLLGTRLPTDTQVAVMERALSLPTGSIALWRDHRLWSLLTEEVAPVHVLDALDSLRGRYRKSVFEDDIDLGDRKIGRVEPDLNDLCRLRKLGGMSGMIALIALTREAQYGRFYERHLRAAAESRRLFAKWVGSSPHLYIRWRLLAEIMMDRVWKMPHMYSGSFWFPAQVDRLDAEVACVVRRSMTRGRAMPPSALVSSPRGAK